MTFNVKYFQYWFLYMFVFTYNDLNNKSQAAILRTISLLSSLFCYSVQLSFLMVFPLWPFLGIMTTVSLLPLSVSVFMMCLYAVKWGVTCPLVMITMETVRSSMGTGWNVSDLTVIAADICSDLCFLRRGQGKTFYWWCQNIVWVVSLSCWRTGQILTSNKVYPFYVSILNIWQRATKCFVGYLVLIPSDLIGQKFYACSDCNFATSCNFFACEQTNSQLCICLGCWFFLMKKKSAWYYNLLLTSCLLVGLSLNRWTVSRPE